MEVRTRSRRSPDLTPQIREWFRDDGFEEQSFEAPHDDLTSVGVHRLVNSRDPPSTRARPDRLFTFIR